MNAAEQKQKVLFYCRRNAVRSQMGEAFLKTFFPERYDAYSAGVTATDVHPTARQVMAEIGIKMSGYRSKNVEEFVGTRFDCVALVCGEPPEVCPYICEAKETINCKNCQGCCQSFPFFPSGLRILHASFDDPTKYISPENDAIGAFRKVRDQIKNWVIENFGAQEA
jgi:arsenate reductase